jgi:hypothetical protein
MNFKRKKTPKENSFDSSSVETSINSTIDDFYFDVDSNESSFFSSDDESLFESSHNEYSSDSSEEFGRFVLDEEKYIYMNSKITMKEFFFLFTKLRLDLNFNSKQVRLIINFIKHILPKPNNISVSKNFYKHFLTNEPKVTHHQVCIKCGRCPENEMQKSCQTCEPEKKFSSFFSFEVKPQIDLILSKKSLSDQIIKSNDFSFCSSKPIENAFNGSIYRNASKKKKKKLLVSLNINSDGAPICHSNSLNMWPIIATIVELDPQSRDKFENLIFIGKLYLILNLQFFL